MAYIDREKARRKLQYIYKTYGISDVVKAKIKNALDDSTVVRCEECKNNPNIKTLTKGMVWCRKFRAEVHPNAFCSYGERKDT